jgi:hypothetical protein
VSGAARLVHPERHRCWHACAGSGLRNPPCGDACLEAVGVHRLTRELAEALDAPLRGTSTGHGDAMHHDDTDTISRRAGQCRHLPNAGAVPSTAAVHACMHAGVPSAHSQLHRTVNDLGPSLLSSALPAGRRRRGDSSGHGRMGIRDRGIRGPEGPFLSWVWRGANSVTMIAEPRPALGGECLKHPETLQCARQGHPAASTAALHVAPLRHPREEQPAWARSAGSWRT